MPRREQQVKVAADFAVGEQCWPKRFRKSWHRASGVNIRPEFDNLFKHFSGHHRLRGEVELYLAIDIVCAEFALGVAEICWV